MALPSTPSTWLEFLLDPSLLELHLAKPGCAPTASQLIIQFLQQANTQASNAASNQKTESNGDSGAQENRGERGLLNKRVTALKILALKTASCLNWNLDILEESVPALFVMSLLLELVRQVTSGAEVLEDQLCPADVTELPDQAVFALQLYHRWCLRMLVKDAMPVRPMKAAPVAVPGLTEPLVTQGILDDDKMNELKKRADASMEVLKACMARGGPILAVGPRCFVMPTENEHHATAHDFSKMTLLTEREYMVPLCFDTGSKHFLDAKYADAMQMFEDCQKFSITLTKSSYATLDAGKLTGYVAACRAIIGKRGEDSTIAKFEAAKSSPNWQRVVDLLVSDVAAMELPSSMLSTLPHEASVRGCPDGHVTRIKFCCDLRAALKNELTLHSADWQQRQSDDTDMAVFMLQVFDCVACSAKFEHYKVSLRCYVRYLLSKCSAMKTFWKGFLNSRYSTALFTENELAALKQELLELSPASTQFLDTGVASLLPQQHSAPATTSSGSTSGPSLWTDAADERQIFFTYDDVLIKRLMLKLHKQSPHFLKNLCESWKLPKEMARGFGQLTGFDASYCFVLTAKARERIRMREFHSAKALLTAAERLAKDVSAKLSKLLRWEILLVDLLRCRHGAVMQLEEVQPQQGDDLSKKVKTCLTALKSEAEIYPGDGLIQECVTFLLNTRDWDYISSLSKSNMHFIEFSRILGDACKEQSAGRGSRVPVKVLWDAVVQIHLESNSFTRRDGGPAQKMARIEDAGTLSKDKLKELVLTLQEPTALSMLLSLFSRLYNLAKGDAVICIPSDLAALWPNALDKVTVDASSVAAVNSALLAHALSICPQNWSWLKMQADICYAAGNYSESMRYYLEAGAVATKFFTEPPPRHVFDDQVYRRMIKCCTAYRCHTQAAILCQFLEDVDYTMAFKCLQERNTYDATDAYYSCIWDVSILEFLVNLHYKRGELEKKQLMLNLIGQQELNSCNGEVVLVRASNIRKAQFLTMLAHQYVNCHNEHSLPVGAELT